MYQEMLKPDYPPFPVEPSLAVYQNLDQTLTVIIAT